MNKFDEFSQDAIDFSLMRGGPMFRLFCRLKICGDYLEFVKRRIILLVAITWIPLLIFSLLNPPHSQVGIPFLYDIEMNIRFLIVLPIFIYSEIKVTSNLNMILAQFTKRGIIIPGEIGRFDRAVDSARKLRTAILPEIVLLILVVMLAISSFGRLSVDQVSTWYVVIDGDKMYNTIAGNWYTYVSIPIFRFIYIRWLYRLFIFWRFLWQVSRLKLHLNPTHPDRAGGLGFLGTDVYAFSSLIFAQGALLSGMIANRIFFAGKSLLDFNMEIGTLVASAFILILVPLFLFTPHLIRTKYYVGVKYGQLANQYVRDFEEKWIDGKNPEKEKLLGTADIQSLADITNSYSTIREMRLIPFGLQNFIQLMLIVILPLLPLALTVMPMNEIIKLIFGMLV